jgi:hypothetical protein
MGKSNVCSTSMVVIPSQSKVKKADVKADVKFLQWSRDYVS